MNRRTVSILAMVLAPGMSTPLALGQTREVFVPLFVYRTGPYAINGVPIANGFVDYFRLINERDGGINGVRISWEECETGYDASKGMECYERFKARRPVLINPYTTGFAYQLVPRAPADRIPVLTMGHGLAAPADGRWFPWQFNLPTSYWSQASAVIRYIGEKEGGMEKLNGKKIAHIYLNNPYGKEASPTLEALARKFGFRLTQLAVNPPGNEQTSIWRQVKRLAPDWIFLTGWGPMNPVAIQQAASIGHPMERLIGNWWSASDADVRPAGAAARGYTGATFHAPGAEFPVHRDILRLLYDKGKGAGKREAVGEVLYNRGLVNAMLTVEAIRTAMTRYGDKPPTGEQVRWGLENLKLSAKRLEELGMRNFMHPLELSCADHEGAGPVLFMAWEGKSWKIASDWIPVMRDVVRPRLEAAAAEEGKLLGTSMRDCANPELQR